MDLSREKTSFNGSQLKLIRIDEIQRNIIIARHNLDLKGWLFSLQDFDMEIETSKNPKEKTILEESLREVESTINKEVFLQKVRKNHNRISGEIIYKLDTIYKQMLGIYHESGLEMQLEQGALGGFGKG